MRFAVAPVILWLAAASCTAIKAHPDGPPTEWGSQFTSPGARLTYRETQRTSVPVGANAVRYRLTAEGFSQGTTYSLWAKGLDGPATEMYKGLRIDPTGQLLKDGAEINLHLGSFFEREAMQFSLVSADGTTRAFVKITPFPIEAKGTGTCRLSLELVSPKGDVFLLWGEGFEPREDIRATGVSDGEQLNHTGRVSEKGDFGSVLYPAIAGKTGGVASITVSGKSRSASLRYNWGQAMKRG